MFRLTGSGNGQRAVGGDLAAGGPQVGDRPAGADQTRDGQIGPGVEPVAAVQGGLTAVHRPDRRRHPLGQFQFLDERELGVEYDPRRATGDRGGRRGQADPTGGEDRHVPSGGGAGAVLGEQMLEQRERGQVTDRAAGLVTPCEQTGGASLDRGHGRADRGHLDPHLPAGRRHLTHRPASFRRAGGEHDEIHRVREVPRRQRTVGAHADAEGAGRPTGRVPQRTMCDGLGSSQVKHAAPTCARHGGDQGRCGFGKRCDHHNQIGRGQRITAVATSRGREGMRDSDGHRQVLLAARDLGYSDMHVVLIRFREPAAAAWHVDRRDTGHPDSPYWHMTRIHRNRTQDKESTHFANAMDTFRRPRSPRASMTSWPEPLGDRRPGEAVSVLSTRKTH